MTDSHDTSYSRRRVLRTTGAGLVLGAGAVGSASANRYTCDDDEGAPRNLSVDGTTDYSVTVSWDAPSGDVDHYRIRAGDTTCNRYECSLSRVLKTQETYDDSVTSATVTGLPFGRDISVAVDAIYSDGTVAKACSVGTKTDSADLAIHRTCPDVVRAPCSKWSEGGGQNELGGSYDHANFDGVEVTDGNGLALDYDGSGGEFSTFVGDEYGSPRTIENHEDKELLVNVVAEDGLQELEDAKLTWNERVESGPLVDYDVRRYPDRPAGERQTLRIPLQHVNRGGYVEWDVDVIGTFKLEFGGLTNNDSRLSIAEMWISG